MDSSVFENFKATLKGGGVRAVSAPHLFATPSDLAARMVELADIREGHRVLEPSAGTGALLREIPSAADVVAVEVNHDLGRALRSFGLARAVICMDFMDMTVSDADRFYRVIMNPPFDNGADIRHIQHALTMLRPGGVLVAICADGPRQQRKLKPLAEESGGFYEPLPSGTFKDAGTMVNTALLLINKED